MTSLGTYREIDESPVPSDEANAAWAEVARQALLEAARSYHSVVTYKELAERVQAESGVHTRRLVAHWIGGVLSQVADTCQHRKEPLLSALCVDRNGSVGKGYVDAVKSARGEAPSDAELHAAHERLSCHRAFGAKLPVGGGLPALTPQVAAQRARTAKAAIAARPLNLCPSCFTQLPFSGQCDNCT